MIFKSLFPKQCYGVLHKAFGEKHFSGLHTRVTNDIISKYSEKAQKSNLRKSGYVYIIDQNAANSIASYICDDWKGGYIFEANPGPGIFSNALLQNGVQKLRTFEKNKDFLPALEALSCLYPLLEIVQEDFLFLPSFDSKFSSKSSDIDLFHGISENAWSDGPPFGLFCIISSKKSIRFARYLLLSLCMKSSIFSFGRCVLYFLTTQKEYMYMTAVPKENFSMYRSSTVLYNIFFEVKFLEKFPSESLFPINIMRNSKKVYGDSFYLMKLTPKPDIFSNMVPENKLTDLYFFVRHHLVKRSSLVIPTMESWIPFCGPRLIKEGMNVFTRFGDLSPNQILLLFNQFSSWPEYEDSAFQAAVHRYYGKESLTYEDEDTS